MAWKCVRCQRRIFAPREDSIAFAIVWKWSSRTRDVTCDILNLHDIEDGATITHIVCQYPEQPEFTQRMRTALKMPKKAMHPLLPERE